jgi:PKD repeat protein
MTILMAIILSIVTGVAFAQNQPPVADAGPDKQAYTGEWVVLNGSATDPDNDPILAWTWEVVEMPANGRYRLVSQDTQNLELLGYVQGDYVVSLTVWDGYPTGIGTDYATVHVADNLPPVAIATADKASGPAPLTVCFDGSQSYDPEGAALSYFWTFGDGSLPASTATVCHEYADAGRYSVLFGVTDVRGANDFEYFSIEANEVTNQPPIASPMATPNAGDAPLTVQFAANGSDPDGDPLTYAWDFGDGATSTLADPQRVYASAGTYVAWLTVSDGNASVSASLTIAVSATIELNVTRAEIKFKGKQSALADVEIRAELYAPVPAADDVVALYLDGAQVFAAPFSQFEAVQHHGSIVPGVYKLKSKHLWVRIDFVQGRLVVDANKVMLTGYDPANGVEVKVMLGDAVAVDNIQPVDEKTDRHYKHHRPERGRGHGQ